MKENAFCSGDGDYSNLTNEQLEILLFKRTMVRVHFKVEDYNRETAIALLELFAGE